MPQINIRFSDEDLAKLDDAIRRVYQVEDPIGQRGEYVRSAALTAARVEDHTRSIAYMLSQYREVCRRARPALDVGEWKVICDALNGYWLGAGLEDGEHASLSAQGIPLEVADYLRLDREQVRPGRSTRAEQWGLTREQEDTLPGRLYGLGYAGLVAVADVVIRFWGHAETMVPGEEGWTEQDDARLDARATAGDVAWSGPENEASDAAQLLLI